MDLDTRTLALALARTRAAVGLAALLAPARAGRATVGPDALRPGARALARMLGSRDVVLGIGAMTAVKEGAHAAEWTGMSALADAADAAVCLLAPGLPTRGRLVGLLAAGSAVAGLALARALAEARPAPTV